MKTHLLRCPSCGGSNLRRSKRKSALEAFRMIVGIYPFRCLDCGTRSELSVWLISKLGTAKCPKCLSPKLVAWPEKYFRLRALGNLMITFGAHRYRCPACRYNFLSFRPREEDRQAQHDRPSTGSEPHQDQAAQT